MRAVAKLQQNPSAGQKIQKENHYVISGGVKYIPQFNIGHLVLVSKQNSP
jgi:hypothetical protein